MSDSSQKILVSELAHIDAPLAIAEITNYGESLKQVPWAKGEFQIHPYCIFERKDGVLCYWYDQHGIDWKIEQAGKFSEDIMREKVIAEYSQIEDIIKNEKALDKQALTHFINKIKDCWTWFDGIWWMIEYRDKNGLDTVGLMETRKHTEYFMPGLIATIRNSFNNIVPKFKDFVDVLRIDEVLSDNFPSIQTLQNRMKTFAYTDGQLFNQIEDVKSNYNIEIKKTIVFENDQLKGQTAYPGKVTGIVKIIKTRDDMKKFESGNVIVSPTTTPDFLPIMKLCSAIISEHGGIICHASITSRELKIPCIVGVRGATQVLKDGMEVEVDAGKGIVKIIK